MKGRIAKILTIIMLIITFVMSDFILIGREIAIAMYEEIESQGVRNKYQKHRF